MRRNYQILLITLLLFIGLALFYSVSQSSQTKSSIATTKTKSSIATTKTKSSTATTKTKSSIATTKTKSSIATTKTKSSTATTPQRRIPPVREASLKQENGREKPKKQEKENLRSRSLLNAVEKFVKTELRLSLTPIKNGECPPLPDKLKAGKINFDLTKPPPTWTQLVKKFANINHGGYSPSWCTPNQRLAILIPFRDREFDLRHLLNHLHTLLPMQALRYRIFVGEMAGRQIYKKGVAMNVLYKEAMRLYNPTCLVFHDADMLADFEFNLYRCSKKPRLICSALNKFKYKYMSYYFGGVVAITPQNFTTANGFSNRLAGWGSSDDVFRDRVLRAGLGRSHTPPKFGRCSMTKHIRDESNIQNDTIRYGVVHSDKDTWTKDGINNVNYNLVFSKDQRLFHHVRFTTTGVILPENVKYSLMSIV